MAKPGISRPFPFETGQGPRDVWDAFARDTSQNGVSKANLPTGVKTLELFAFARSLQPSI